MLSFKDFSNGSGYISTNVSKSDSDKIHKILKDLQISDYIPDLHVTLMYDVSNPSIKLSTPKNQEFETKATGVKLLGKPGTKWYAIALVLESKDLQQRFNELKDKGFKHSYPDFIPHVSLKYSPTDDDVKTIKTNLDKFKFSIKLEQEVAKPIKE